MIRVQNKTIMTSNRKLLGRLIIATCLSVALLLLLLSDDDDSLSTRQYNDLNHRLLYNTPTDNSNTSTNEQQSYLELLQSKIKESTIDIIDSDIAMLIMLFLHL